MATQWREAVGEFEAQVRELNVEIDRYNLIVPAAWQQLPHFRVRRAVEQACVCVCVRTCMCTCVCVCAWIRA